MEGRWKDSGWKGGGRTVPYLQIDRTRRVLVASALARERALAVEGGEREVNGVSTMDTQLQR